MIKVFVYFRGLVLFSVMFWVLMPSLVNAQIVVGEINGSFTDKEKPYDFHGYLVLIETPSKYFNPVLSALDNKMDSKSEYLMITSAWAQKVDAFLAINTSFFDPEKEYKPNDLRLVFGPTKANGKLISSVLARPDKKGNPALLFDKKGNPTITMATEKDVDAAYNVIGAQWEGSDKLGNNGSLLIEKGVMKGRTTLPAPLELAPRTGVGLTEDNQVLMIIMIEGRLPSSAGVTLPQFALLFKKLGAYNAINFDGGGSSTISYVPNKNIPIQESLRLYNMLKSSIPKSNETNSLQFFIKQRDARIPFASSPSGNSIFESALMSKSEKEEKQKAQSNQLYRPVAAHLGFGLKQKESSCWLW